MKRHLLTILMMACAIVFVFSSCKKDKVDKNNNNGTSQETPTHPDDPAGDGIIENAVTDVDGNTYKAVKLGDQVWMAENLRTTKYADNTSIPLGNTYSYTVAYRYCPNNDSSNVATYGYLYNWKAVMRNSSSSSNNPSGVQGICPNGWHVPSEAEWTQLSEYLSESYYCSTNYEHNAKAIASTTGWSSSTIECAIGNDPNSNNITGFTAVPAGKYYSHYRGFGDEAYFWCSTESYNEYVYVWILSYNVPFVGRDNNYGKDSGLSVRCVRD